MSAVIEKKTLTHWTRPSEVLDSQHGRVTYRTWCEKECNRINGRSGGDSVRIIEKGGMIALTR